MLASERRALPSSLVRQSFTAVLDIINTVLLQNETSVLFSYTFFEKSESGVSLAVSNISVSHDSVNIAMKLLKN